MQTPRFLSTIIFGSLLICLVACRKKDNPPDTEYRISSSITVDGRERTYILNLPPNYYDASGFSLIIGLHGGGGSGEQFETSTNLTAKANASSFIVVYPDGVQGTGLLKARTWNAGGCCDYASENNINDVKFISELIDKLLASYKINPKKIYAAGHSNGGMLAYRLACELSNKIAAIAPNASTMVVDRPCAATRAVPILHMHSVLDMNVPYQGGVGSGFSGHYNPPLDSVMNVWRLRSICTNKNIVDNSSYKVTKWFNCRDNVSIHYYLTKDGGHAWPGGQPGSLFGDTPSAVINANDLLWDFFQQHQLP
jgi:polyhydroxybutyrate depolymerase